MPMHSQPLFMAETTTARMTAFSPGASPPPVLMAMRRILPLDTVPPCTWMGSRKRQRLRYLSGVPRRNPKFPIWLHPLPSCPDMAVPASGIIGPKFAQWIPLACRYGHVAQPCGCLFGKSSPGNSDGKPQGSQVLPCLLGIVEPDGVHTDGLGAFHVVGIVIQENGPFGRDGITFAKDPVDC